MPDEGKKRRRAGAEGAGDAAPQGRTGHRRAMAMPMSATVMPGQATRRTDCGTQVPPLPDNR